MIPLSFLPSLNLCRLHQPEGLLWVEKLDHALSIQESSNCSQDVGVRYPLVVRIKSWGVNERYTLAVFFKAIDLGYHRVNTFVARDYPNELPSTVN
jgi:hypothetical protein